MSTRCNILIYEQDKFVGQVYHHTDGYFSGVGSILADIVVEYWGEKVDFRHQVKDFKQYLLDWNDSLCGKALHTRFEDDEEDGKLTEPDTHGDIDYLYKVIFNKNKEVEIQCHSRAREGAGVYDHAILIVNDCNTQNYFASEEWKIKKARERGEI